MHGQLILYTKYAKHLRMDIDLILKLQTYALII